VRRSAKANIVLKDHSVMAASLLERNFRLNNQKHTNIMTLDNDKQAWATLGLSDQFGRHWCL
jgi:hypothetical protein